MIRPARRGRAAPVTTFIIAVTAAVFLIGLVSSDIRQELFAALAQVNVLVAAGEWWRLITPVLLEKVGPWAAFGLPGVLMGVATLIFWMGRRKFVHVPPAGLQRFKEETFSPDGMRAVLNLAPVFLIFIPMFWAIFDQTGSA